MTFDDLKRFLTERMSMSHIYQPLVIRTLVESGGRASVRSIAREFLSYDEAQVEYYIRIVKRWPKATLTKHGVIDTSERGYFRLTLDLASLTEQERAEIVALCDGKIRQYIEGYKGIIGDYRYNPDDLSSSSVRYLVLKLANGRCALCGASVKDTPLDIDHIIPRNQGGTNDLSNLQALCFRCNRAKRDRDFQDFRSFGEEEQDPACPFCAVAPRVVLAYNSARCIRDAFPVTEHHTLLLPRRHVLTVSELSAQEITDLFQLAKVAKASLQEQDRSISGFNLGFNDGAAAGQTVPHVHMHLIPRRAGDVSDPRGGLRGVIPGAAAY
jgi:ATP adenylyltransferase